MEEVALSPKVEWVVNDNSGKSKMHSSGDLYKHVFYCVLCIHMFLYVCVYIEMHVYGYTRTYVCIYVEVRSQS